jgi:hypothetical protein
MINVADLQETNEELQAQMLTRSLEEGRNLLTGVGNGNSLAEELEAMSAQEVGSYSCMVAVILCRKAGALESSPTA